VHHLFNIVERRVVIKARVQPQLSPIGQLPAERHSHIMLGAWAISSSLCQNLKGSSEAMVQATRLIDSVVWLNRRCITR
jgi:hypothetical protein